MRERGNDLDAQSPAFADYKNFLLKLRGQFELGIYNLNYDTVALNTWPEAFLGSDRFGNFDPACVNQRRLWNSLSGPSAAPRDGERVPTVDERHARFGVRYQPVEFVVELVGEARHRVDQVLSFDFLQRRHVDRGDRSVVK